MESVAALAVVVAMALESVELGAVEAALGAVELVAVALGAVEAGVEAGAAVAIAAGEVPSTTVAVLLSGSKVIVGAVLLPPDEQALAARVKTKAAAATVNRPRIES